MSRSPLIAVLIAGLIAGPIGCERRPSDTRDLSGAPPDSVAELIPQGVAGLHAILPTIALVGEPVDLRVAPLNELGIPDSGWSGRLEMQSSDPALVTFAPFEPATAASFRRSIVFRTPGVHRVTVRSDAGLEAIAGPVRVVRTVEELRPRPGEAARFWLWGDVHGHTDLGDGTNPPPSYMVYGRDIAFLDWTCLSEHDFQQFLEVGLDESASAWDSVATLAREWRRPGFAVLLGWEWSSREHGHRVVLFPDDRSRYVSFRQADTPADLAEALTGTGAISILAHPIGSRLTPAIRWETVAPGFDRAVEIYSGHGSNDGSDFRPTSEPETGHTALEAIRRGLPLAFVCFSDTHLSTPGNPWPPVLRDAPYRGGMTAVHATGPSEREIFDALAAGRCYGTSGPRFLVDLHVEDRRPGETLELPRGSVVRVRALVAAPRPMRAVEVWAGDRIVRRLTEGGAEMLVDVPIGPLEKDTVIWLTGGSEDDERFWTTPIFVTVF